MKAIVRVALVLLILGLRLDAQTPQQDAATQLKATADALKAASDGLTKAAAAIALIPPAAPIVTPPPVATPPPVVTPPQTTGKTTTLSATANLQTALNLASCGDTILLPTTGVYASSLTAAKPCAAAAPITVQAVGVVASAAAARMPAGAQLPKITPTAGEAFTVNATGSGLVLRGLDILGAFYDSVLVSGANVTIDQCWIHGTPTGDFKRGVALNGVNVSVTRSSITDIHGTGQDSQAIAGWNGPGPFVIDNNLLEAASENILFGGSDPSVAGLVPSNITITRNLVRKPPTWKGNGHTWNVKNLLELKSAAHVTISGNVFENVWADAQEGYALVLTVRNQDGGCPQCTIQDVKVTGNVVRHAGAFSNILGLDDGHGIGAPSVRASGLVISNNLAYDIDPWTWGGSGRIFQVIDGPNGLTIDHNTLLGSHLNSLFTLQNGTYPIAGLVFTNNVAAEGDYGIIGAGDVLGVSAQILPHYAPGFTWSANVIVHASTAGNYAYPAGTTVSAPVVNADYSVQAGFPAGVGVDLSALKAAIAGLDLTK